MLDWIKDIVPLLSIGIAACAAFFAYLAAKSTKDATNANIASNLLNDYSSDEMSSSIRTIINFFNCDGYENDKESSFKLFKNGIGRRLGESHPTSPGYKVTWEELDQARRKIHWYYKSAYQLYEKKLIDREVLEIITGTNGYNVFCNIVIRMTLDIHPGKDPEQHFKWFDKMKAEFSPKDI